MSFVKQISQRFGWLSKLPRWLRRTVGIAAVLFIGYHVWRWNSAAIIAVAICVHAWLLAVTCFDLGKVRPPTAWPLWISQVFYPAGLVLGMAVATGSSNTPVRWTAIVILCGIHAVAVAAALTLLAHKLQNWNSLSPAQLVASWIVAVFAILTSVTVDFQHAYRVFDVSGGLYAVLVIVVVLTTNTVTLNYLRSKSGGLLPVLPAVVGFGALAGGATVLLATLLISAWWRNNAPVTGPALENLPAIPTVAMFPPTAVVDTYVALGDSYSAGEGLRPFDAFTDSDPAKLGDGCHRSSQAFSQLLRFAAPAPAIRFVACSGAVTREIFSPRDVSSGDHQLVIPPQVGAGVHPEVGLVTITIGGNDVVFSAVVTDCFLKTDCLSSRFTPPADDPERGVDLPPAQRLDSWAPAAIEIVKSKVRVLFPALKTSYPNARIVVIGYPYLFPDRQAPLLNFTDCQTVLRRFDHTERVGVRQLQDQLNQMLHDEAAIAEIEFVSPAAGWNTHEPCGTSDEQYTNSIKPFVVSSLTGVSQGDGGTFHPNHAGQRELARLTTCYLVAHPTAPTLVVGEDPVGSLTNPVPDCAT